MNRIKRSLMALSAVVLILAAIGCSERNPMELQQGRAVVDPVVFDDALSEDVYNQPFFETHYTAMETDSVWAYDGFAPDGARSLKLTVPPQGSSLGPYSGGVLTSGASRDLTDFNALTFYARADVPIALNTAGFGNDNTGTSQFQASRPNIPLTGDWTYVVVPIPEPSRLIAERGLFAYAEGAEDSHPEGYAVWFDEIRFATVDSIEVFRPTMDSGSRQYFVGSYVAVTGTFTIFRVSGAIVRVDHSAGYFDYVSSDPAVAEVTRDGILVTGAGETAITGDLQGVDIFGIINLTAYDPPADAAPSPTKPAGDVISLFSDVYQDEPVDTWRTDWSPSRTQVADYAVNGDVTKMYTGLTFVGIDFLGSPIDASAMTHFNLDVFAPEGTDFKVKLVSFPGGGTTPVETNDLVLTAETTPAFVAGEWSSLDLPLADFETPEDFDWTNVGQLVLSTADAELVLVDNVYWHR